MSRQGAMAAASMQMAMAGAGAGSNGRLAACVGFQDGRAALSVGYANALNDRLRNNFGAAITGSEASAGFGIGIDQGPSARAAAAPVCAVARPGDTTPSPNWPAARTRRRVAVPPTCRPRHD